MTFIWSFVWWLKQKMITSIPKILRIDSSARPKGSASRSLNDLAVATLQAQLGVIKLTQRDMRTGIGNISSAWRDASLTPDNSRSSDDRSILAQTEALASEVAEADMLLIAAPIYNFNIPAALKSWIDLICRDNIDGARARDLTGSFKHKQALVVLTSNYTKSGAADDFATPYLGFMLKFIGIDEVTFIDATGLADNRDSVLARAEEVVIGHCSKLSEIWNEQLAAE
jgi:FMN-dependent NADH-azoreductase